MSLSARYYAYKNDLINIKEAEKFNFTGECPNCQKDMTNFTAENKNIYMCEHCGCIYLPKNMRNIKLYNYKYKKHKGVFEPLCREPTQSQLDYLELLAKRTGTEVNLCSITKDEAIVLIEELKEKPLLDAVEFLLKEIKNSEKYKEYMLTKEHEENNKIST